MKNAYTLALAAASLILVGQGCAPLAPPADLPTAPPAAEVVEKKEEGAMEPKEDVMMEKKEEGAMMEDKDVMMKKTDPTYVDYSASLAEAAMKEGRGVVLYFYAAWCPICRAEDPHVKAWIEGSGLGVSGFRVNYDTEKDLKAKYRIPYQHTTVFLNVKGEEVERFSGPVTEAEFDAALAKAAGK